MEMKLNNTRMVLVNNHTNQLLTVAMFDGKNWVWVLDLDDQIIEQFINNTDDKSNPINLMYE